MKWEQFFIGAWMLFMFTMQTISAYGYYLMETQVKSAKQVTVGAYLLMIMAGSWLVVVGVLHSGGFW